jgi:hypothetical protein
VQPICWTAALRLLTKLFIDQDYTKYTRNIRSGH